MSASSDTKKGLLVVLDGWGLGPVAEADAIAQADTPFFDRLMKEQPHATLVTYGEEVGLPYGQMGNSEVGHMNIGAGRIVYQDLLKINRAIAQHKLESMPIFEQFLAAAKKTSGKVHVMGLLSDGGVHSHIDHLKAICEITTKASINNVFIHAFLDGRDTDPHGGASYLNEMQTFLQDKNIEIASLTGRYYAMDRDKRWERVKQAYDAIVCGDGEKSTNIAASLQERYEEGQTDEFILPIIAVDESNEPLAVMEDGDVVLFFNFRADRPRELTEMLAINPIDAVGTQPLKLDFYTMTSYSADFKDVHVIFDKSEIEGTIGAVVSRNGLTQVRVAETEKYPHVTYFLNGGREAPFDGEDRIMVPSPKVATYDLQPEMSAAEVTQKLLKKMQEDAPDFICLNFANTDMVGHTGVFNAAMQAASFVDNCLKQIVEMGKELNYEMIIIADHGNSDYMINDDGSPNTAHTKNPVPIIYVGSKNDCTIHNGILADVAPTLLECMGLKRDNEMSGQNLLKLKSS